jgi:uncharacterized protein
VIERDVSIDVPGAVLAGTFCAPGDHGRFPAALMVHGSGPVDRDENMRHQRLDIFNTLAFQLAEHGVASLRYDKRGCGRSTGDYWKAGYWDLVGDATTAFDALRMNEAVVEQRLFVLGHSEGCAIAAEIGLRRAAVSGLVLLAPFLHDVETLLLEQAQQVEDEFRRVPGWGGRLQRAPWAVLGSPVVQQRKLIARLRTSRADSIRILFQKVPAKALRELLDLDVSALFQKVECPLLLIGGQKDVQCPPADAERIAEITPGPAEANVVADLTHVLRCDSGPPSLLGSFALLKKPVEPTVLDLVTDWIQRQMKT